MNETDFVYTGKEIEEAIHGLKAYGIAAKYPRDIVLDLCSEMRNQVAAQRQERSDKRVDQPLKPRDPFIRDVYNMLREVGWTKVFYFVDNRKNFRRIKFMEYYKIHDAAFRITVAGRLSEIIRMHKIGAGYSWEVLSCHGPYEALIIRIAPTK
jgi:hypothetical protein